MGEARNYIRLKYWIILRNLDRNLVLYAHTTSVSPAYRSANRVVPTVARRFRTYRRGGKTSSANRQEGKSANPNRNGHSRPGHRITLHPTFVQHHFYFTVYITSL